MLCNVGLKEQRERKNKSKVTQELVERKVNKKKNIQEESRRDKMIKSGRFSRYVKEGKKSLMYT